ncbi:MAG: fumarylacetoacetate hydrolase family protein [Candidatus Hydrogenedentota bacterium]
MRIARIAMQDESVTLAVQQPGGALVRAAGNILEQKVLVTDEPVVPKRWLPPLDPAAILCIGRNYAEHAKEGGADLPEYPVLFAKNPGAAHGHLDPIRIPSVCEDEVDYEGELAVVIGRPAKNVSEEEAPHHIAGYMVANDVSARIWQQHKGGSQWVRGKSFDTFAPMGPFLVTPDEAPDVQNLGIRTLLNGQEMQTSNTRHMIFPIARLISFLSQDTTLLPGTVILTGTPEGVGWFKEPRTLLHPGNTVAVEIEAIGTLENPVGA